MSPSRKFALASLSSKFVYPYHSTPPDWSAIYGRPAPLILDIGFGNGISTAQIARVHPNSNFLGVEVYIPGIAALLKLIYDYSIENIRVIRYDAMQVLENMISPGSLQGVQVFFPDPWQKNRHNKRRLVQPPFAKLVSSRLALGGYIHCATDWYPYANQMIEVFESEPGLRNTASRFSPRPDYRPVTKFETRAHRMGYRIWDIIYIRN